MPGTGEGSKTDLVCSSYTFPVKFSSTFIQNIIQCNRCQGCCAANSTQIIDHVFGIGSACSCAATLDGFCFHQVSVCVAKENVFTRISRVILDNTDTLVGGCSGKRNIFS